MKIEDYAVIGDLHTVALVGVNGSIDWLCLPRFDSAACFASLLGDESNGYWKISPADAGVNCARRYRGDTLILETEWKNENGTVRVTDFMPIAGCNRDVVRIAEGLSGSMALQMSLVVRFDYGRTVPWVRHLAGGGIVAVAGPSALTLRTAVPVHGQGLTTVADFTVRAGDRHTFVLSAHSSHESAGAPGDPEFALRETEKYWEHWSAHCTYRGPWRGPVMRSLITLKALTYAPTGGIVAAATTSLPEWIGGVRNWDYRYCWLRDATFTLYSFLSSGYRDEAQAWSEWLLRAVAGDPAQLQIMYGVAGERSLPELEVPHLRGYEGSRPVRIGNAAAAQFQLDVYGEVMDAMHLSRTLGIKTGDDAWRLQRHLADFVVQHWREPDEGIWEIRGPKRHFTHSKVMAWVALDRAVKAVRDFGLDGDAGRWATAREEIHSDVCTRGFGSGPQAFTQYYGGDALDAALLMLPLVGFLPPTDPRVISTVDAIARELTVNGLVQRYKTEAKGEVDGLPPGEGTFLPCSFWLADCLHLLGREMEARDLFQRLLALRNDLGLVAEEYDPVAGRQLGNVPQAFTHVCMVNTALNLSPRTAKPAEERSTGITPHPFGPRDPCA
jgi:GH15 family glucan-1,4-alpha-glucosidase